MKIKVLSKIKSFLEIILRYTFLYVFYFDLNILAALCGIITYWLKSVIDLSIPASDQKRILNELNYQSNLSAHL